MSCDVSCDTTHGVTDTDPTIIPFAAMECGPHTKGEIITLLSFEAGFSFWELGTGPRAFTDQPRIPNRVGTKPESVL